MKWYEKNKKAFETKESEPAVAKKEVNSSYDKTDEPIEKETTSSTHHEVEATYTMEEPVKVELEDEKPFFMEVEEPAEPELPDTVITANAIINGDIETIGNLIIDGVINGNIKTQGNVHIQGKVTGNIVCDNAFFSQAQVQGNVEVAKKLEIYGETEIQGDIYTEDMISNGRIKGNIKALNIVKLQKNAYIEGNVEAQYMESERGSILRGQCTVLPKDMQ